MAERPRSSTTLIAIIIFSGLVFAIANLAMVTWSVQGAIDVPLLVEFFRTCAPCVAYFVVAPLVVAILVAIMVQRLIAATNRAVATVPIAPAATATAPALRLLGLLQQEGRFVDFLQEDIDGYDDGQVGAAVRSIHAGCRKALQERIVFERVYSDAEGSTVSVAEGFDANAVRLSGNVTGGPPFKGTLQHGGWRAIKVALPESTGGDPTVVAPAEVEIP
jgi:hypothetical protein